MSFLIIKDLSARYFGSKGPVYAVEDVDFNLNEGESIGIAGGVHVEKVLQAYPL